MNLTLIGRNIALMVVFAVAGVTLFTENVRTVQILGLFACGAVFGISLVGFVAALTSKKMTTEQQSTLLHRAPAAETIVDENTGSRFEAQRSGGPNDPQISSSQTVSRAH